MVASGYGVHHRNSKMGQGVKVESQRLKNLPSGCY